MKETMPHKGKELVASANYNSTVSESPKEGGVTILKRKRGRPSKGPSRLGTPNTTKAENSRPNVADVERPLVDEFENPVAVVEPLSKSNSSFSDPHSTCTSISCDQCKLSPKLNFGKTSVGKKRFRKYCKIPIAASEPANTFTSRGMKFESIREAEIPTKDAADISIGEDPYIGVGQDVTVVAVTSSNACENDKSAWLEGAHTPSETDACQLVETGVMRDAITTQSCCQLEEVQQETDENSPGNSSHDNDATQRPDETLIKFPVIVPREDQELPFSKKSPAWGVIESMEVFKRFPQKPHFLPLYELKESFREGMAIGSMVTFANLAQIVSEGRFDDLKRRVEEQLDVLFQLEKLGFNVEHMQEVLHKLISLQKIVEQAENKLKELKSQIMDIRQEESKAEDEIAELDKKRKKLKDKQERRGTEKTKLELTVDFVEGSLEDAQHEFGKLTALFR